MRTIVFLDTHNSGSSREALQAAEQMGLYTVLLTNRENLLHNRTKFPEVHQMLLADLEDQNDLRQKIQSLEQQGKIIDAIVSFVDPYVFRATQLAEEWDVNRISSAAVEKMEDKILTRIALQNTVYGPYFDIYKETDSLPTFLNDQFEKIPLIVKSPKSCGSKDVILANNLNQLRSNIKKLLIKYPLEPVLVEEYLDGPQYLVEVLVDEGEVCIVAIFEQEIQEDFRFIVTGYSLLAEVPSTLLNRLESTVIGIVNALGMVNGAFHLEMRYVKDMWKLVEINPRIAGGAMNKMIEVAFGINLVKETIKLMLGERPDLQKKQEKYVFTQYVTVHASGILERVTGKKRALRHQGVQEVYIKPHKGTYLSVPLSMGHRYAYVLAASDSKESARQIAKTAAGEIHFHLLPM